MGLDPNQVAEVRGFAYTQPKVAGDPGDPRNRRIAIIVVNDYSGMNYLDKSMVLDSDEASDTSQADDE